MLMHNYKILKTKRQFISELIAILGFVFLSSFFGICDLFTCSANEIRNQLDAQKDHTSSSISNFNKDDVMNALFENYSKLNDKVQTALNTIWDNEIGNLLLQNYRKSMTSNSKKNNNMLEQKR